MSASSPLFCASIGSIELPENSVYSACCLNGDGSLTALALALPGARRHAAEFLGQVVEEQLHHGCEPADALTRANLPDHASAVAVTLRNGLLTWECTGKACLCGYRAGGCRILTRRRQQLLPGDRLLLLTQHPAQDALTCLTFALAAHVELSAVELLPLLCEDLRELSPKGAFPCALADYRPQGRAGLDTGNHGARREIYVSSRRGNREDQQDCCGYCCEGDTAMVVIADGAGGHVAGALASRVAVDCALSFWDRCLRHGLKPEKAEAHFSAFMQETNSAVYREARQEGREGNGRAAMVFYYQHRQDVYILHIGDCRAYTWTEEEGWSCLTRDDSEVRAMVDAGEITEEQAWHHPCQNHLLQALGAAEPVEVHYRHLRSHYHQVFMLCCDGLWNQLPPERWQQDETYGFDIDSGDVLRRWVHEAADCAEGYSDNVTAALIVPEVDTMPSSPLWQKIAFILLTFIAIVLGVWYAWQHRAGRSAEYAPKASAVESSGAGNSGAGGHAAALYNDASAEASGRDSGVGDAGAEIEDAAEAAETGEQP